MGGDHQRQQGGGWEAAARDGAEEDGRRPSRLKSMFVNQLSENNTQLYVNELNGLPQKE